MVVLVYVTPNDDDSNTFVVFPQTAIPVLIGTKFDDFIQLPIDLQWTIASQVNVIFFNDFSCNFPLLGIQIGNGNR